MRPLLWWWWSSEEAAAEQHWELGRVLTGGGQVANSMGSTCESWEGG